VILHGQNAAQSQAGRAKKAGGKDEAELINRVATGELRAFEALYRIYHSRLTRFLLNILRRPQMVEEVLNDTMMVVWRRADSYNHASKVSTWIFAIGYRKALKALKRLDEPIEDKFAEMRESPEAGPDRELDRRQLGEALAGAMAGLSAEQRTVVDLTYFHEMGYREIAEVMDCPVDTVKTRMFYARRHLRGMLPGSMSDWL
jgi:RNA polymerase sigma-70 factor (ECF subfamily)